MKQLTTVKNNSTLSTYKSYYIYVLKEPEESIGSVTTYTKWAKATQSLQIPEGYDDMINEING